MNGTVQNKGFAGVAFMAGIFLNPAMSQTPADQNFKTRCQAPGVVKCMGFDTRSQTDMPGRVGSVALDTAVKASGAGSMLVDIPPTAGEGPGNVIVTLGKDFGEGSSLYIQWRQRFSPAMVDGALGGVGFKQFVLYDQSPSGNVETYMLNQGYRGFPVIAAAMGRQQMQKRVNGSTALMWNAEGVICSQSDMTRCLKYHPNEWMTFYYEQHIGNWDQPNSTVKAYMAREGQPLQQFIHFDKEWQFNKDEETSAYRRIWLGPFSNGRTANGNYPAASTWFDELIISTQPIPDPFQAGTGVRNPVHGNSGLGVRINPIDARVRISFPNPDRHAKVWIQDMQGGTVKTFSGVKDQTVEWDAAGMGNGVYLFQVSAGNRRFVQKASILR